MRGMGEIHKLLHIVNVIGSVIVVVVVVTVVVVIARLKFRVMGMRGILLFGKIFIHLVIFSLFRS